MDLNVLTCKLCFRFLVQTSPPLPSVFPSVSVSLVHPLQRVNYTSCRVGEGLVAWLCRMGEGI